MADTFQNQAVDEPAEFGEGEQALVKRWTAELSVAEKEFTSGRGINWFDEGDKIVRRFRDERNTNLANDGQSAANKRAKFNILWANVSLLQPALYARTPIPEVVRRFKERDPVARAAATLQERAIAYTIDTQDFDGVMKAVVQDRLLPGRGTIWVRYVPTMVPNTPKVPVSPYQVDDEEFGADGTLTASSLQYQSDEGGIYEESAVLRDEDQNPYIDGEPYDEVVDEKVAIDYVFWKDFSHNPCRNWAEVRWVSRRLYMTRTQLRDRFGDKIGNAVKLNYTPKGTADDDGGAPTQDAFKKAIVHEIWDKDTKKAYWINTDYEHGPLDTKDDPLGLENFFPCPKPLYATQTTDTMVPVPDYLEYIDQAKELDILTGRMQRLMKALKLSGVYNSAMKGALQELLDSGENTLVPVDSWAGFSEKGGLNANVEWLPMQEVAATLLSVGQMREQVKADLYEITGLSDVMRGSTKASETATAQRLKGQYGSLRLRDSVGDVQRFARDTLRIVGEVIAEQFAPETIQEIAGMEMPTRAQVAEANSAVQEIEQREEHLKQLPPEEAQKISASQAMPDKSDMDDIRDIANDVPFEDAIELLQDQGHRTFRLDVETDSTIAADETEDRQDRIEFLNAASSFMKMSAEMGQQVPEFIPVLGQMMMFGIRGFKVGRQLEDSFEDALQAIQRRVDRQDDEPQEDPRLALMKRKEDREDKKVEIDAVDKQARASLEARSQDIEALDDKTGHEIDREELRAKTGQSEKGLEQAATIEVVNQLNK